MAKRTEAKESMLELLAGIAPALHRATGQHGMRDELTEERLFVTELLNDENVAQFSVARCRVLPGVTTQRHALDVNEWYLIEAGLGEMRLGDDQPFEVVVRDCVQIPAGVPQQITNHGDDDLVFLCICLPRFTPAAYQSLET